jgi:hypothetical protein
VIASAVEVIDDDLLEAVMNAGDIEHVHEAEATVEAVIQVVERKRVRPLLNLIRDLTDRDECWLDHNGGCQAHGYISLEPGEECPHAEAKKILGREGIEL